MKPNLIIIGAARSGTTSLHKYLECHPEIFMSRIKEINFFSNEKYWKKGIKWYESHFHAKEKIVGESSTSYTNYPRRKDVARRMHSYIPDVKLIYLLRDPIDRFISHYLHKIKRGLEDRKISEIITNESDDFFWQSKYYTQLRQYLEYYPKTKIFIATIDEMKNKPNETLKNIFEFLNVDTTFSCSDFYLPHNVNKKVTKKSRFGKSIGSSVKFVGIILAYT